MSEEKHPPRFSPAWWLNLSKRIRETLEKLEGARVKPHMVAEDNIG